MVTPCPAFANVRAVPSHRRSTAPAVCGGSGMKGPIATVMRMDAILRACVDVRAGDARSRGAQAPVARAGEGGHDLGRAVVFVAPGVVEEDAAARREVLACALEAGHARARLVLEPVHEYEVPRAALFDARVV